MNVKRYFQKNQSFLIFVFVLFCVRWSFADHNRIPTGSMEPAVHVGDHLAINKMAYDLKVPFTNFVVTKMAEPRRGDIVVFKYPQDESINFLKRLIGLPGDHIVVEDGFITINGEKVPGSGSPQELSYFEIWKNEKVQINRNSLNRLDDVQEFVVPEEMYFFMGDNRDNSSDSRSWGFVPRKNLKGRAHFVLWNISFKDLVPQIEIDRIGKLLQ